MKKAIGIVGGVGPAAGTDLAEKVFRHTKADKDQDHIDLYLTSCPSIIPDRTGFLLEGGPSPTEGLTECARKLASLGATAIGVCCNTAHAHTIMDAVVETMKREYPGAEMVNLIDTAVGSMAAKYPEGAKIGLLATCGTIKTGVYSEYFKAYPKLEEVLLSDEENLAVHCAIYDKTYGIKATPTVTEKARKVIKAAVEKLRDLGCKAVILGCTELPLALKNGDVEGVEIADPTELLALELIRRTAPEKLC